MTGEPPLVVEIWENINGTSLFQWGHQWYCSIQYKGRGERRGVFTAFQGEKQFCCCWWWWSWGRRWRWDAHSPAAAAVILDVGGCYRGGGLEEAKGGGGEGVGGGGWRGSWSGCRCPTKRLVARHCCCTAMAGRSATAMPSGNAIAMCNEHCGTLHY